MDDGGSGGGDDVPARCLIFVTNLCGKKACLLKRERNKEENFRYEREKQIGHRDREIITWRKQSVRLAES